MINIKVDHCKQNLRINNYFIDLYLNDLKKRLNINQKPFFRDYIIIMIYLFHLLKLCVPLLIKLDYQTLIIIYDVPIFFGGIEKYTRIAFILGCFVAIYLHKMLYLTTSKKLMVWTQLFEMTRGNISPLQLGLDINDSIIVHKFIIRVRFVYKIMSISIISYGIVNSYFFIICLSYFQIWIIMKSLIKYKFSFYGIIYSTQFI